VEEGEIEFGRCDGIGERVVGWIAWESVRLAERVEAQFSFADPLFSVLTQPPGELKGVDRSRNQGNSVMATTRGPEESKIDRGMMDEEDASGELLQHAVKDVSFGASVVQVHVPDLVDRRTLLDGAIDSDVRMPGRRAPDAHPEDPHAPDAHDAVGRRREPRGFEVEGDEFQALRVTAPAGEGRLEVRAHRIVRRGFGAIPPPVPRLFGRFEHAKEIGEDERETGEKRPRAPKFANEARTDITR